MEGVPDDVAMAMICYLLDHVGLDRFAKVSRKQCRLAFQSKRLRSVMEFGPRTEDGIALLN